VKYEEREETIESNWFFLIFIEGQVARSEISPPVPAITGEDSGQLVKK